MAVHPTHPRRSLVESPHKHLNNRKRSSADRHSPHQRRRDALPEAPRTLGPPRLREAVPHGLVLLVLAEPVRLHLALDDVERVAAQPQHLAREAAVRRDLERRDVLPVDAVAPRVRVHHPLEAEEPEPVRLRLTHHRDGRAAVHAPEEALVGAQLAHAVHGALVQPPLAVRLRLQPDADVLDGAGQRRVGHAGEGARREVLGVGEGVGGLVAALEPAAGLMEGAELDRDAGADADERRERALVEGQGALLLIDRSRGREGARVGRRGLEADLDDVEGLAWAGGLAGGPGVGGVGKGGGVRGLGRTDEDLRRAADGAREEVLDRLARGAGVLDLCCRRGRHCR